MEYLLPDDDTISLMNEEYAKMGVKNASIFALNDTNSAHASEHTHVFVPKILILFLYTIKFLSYNSKYGTEIYDPNGSVGRIQSGASAFRVVNNLF